MYLNFILTTEVTFRVCVCVVFFALFWFYLSWIFHSYRSILKDCMKIMEYLPICLTVSLDCIRSMPLGLLLFFNYYLFFSPRNLCLCGVLYLLIEIIGKQIFFSVMSDMVFSFFLTYLCQKTYSDINILQIYSYPLFKEVRSVIICVTSQVTLVIRW